MRGSRVSVAGYLLVSGTYSLVKVIDSSHVYSFGSATAPYVWVVTVYSVMVASGVLLLRYGNTGRWVAVAAMACQTPMFQIGRLCYTIAAAPSMELKLWPRFGFGFYSGHTFAVYTSPAELPIYLGVNVASVFVACCVLAFVRELSPRSVDKNDMASGASAS